MMNLILLALERWEFCGLYAIGNICTGCLQAFALFLGEFSRLKVDPMVLYEMDLFVRVWRPGSFRRG